MEFIVEKIGMSRTVKVTDPPKNSCNNKNYTTNKKVEKNTSEIGAEEKVG